MLLLAILKLSQLCEYQVHAAEAGDDEAGVLQMARSRMPVKCLLAAQQRVTNISDTPNISPILVLPSAHAARALNVQPL